MTKTKVAVGSLRISVGILLLSVCISACHDKKPHEHKLDQDGNGEEMFHKELSDYSPELLELWTGMDGDFRGLTFGMTKENVEAVERANFQALEIDSLGGEMKRYALEFNLENNADMEYYFASSNALNYILVTLYSQKISDRDKFYKEFQTYFTGEYGQAKGSGDELKWHPRGEIEIKMTKEGGASHPNLVIEISPV